MSAPTRTRDAELAALRRPFLLGSMACLAAIVCLGGVIAAFGQADDRPAGVAERWLTAVSDSTREGLAADAAVRAEENGAPIDLAARAGVLPPGVEAEAAFEELRVGRAVLAGTAGAPAGPAVRVPFTYTPRDGEPAGGHLYLGSTGEGWQVIGLQPSGDAGILLATTPAEPGLEPATPGEVEVERPAPAPIGWWLGTLLVSGLIAAGCTAAIRAATPEGA